MSGRLKPVLVGLGRLVLIPGLFCLVLWLGGLFWFAATIPQDRDTAANNTATDAIVVLTGGSRRLRAGLEMLQADRARKLFVSGVHRGTDVPAMLQANAASDGSGHPDSWSPDQLDRWLECCIVLDHQADDTFGNARETAIWMAGEGFSSLRIVTSNYHLRRSLFEFRRAMPKVRMVPHPVYPDQFETEGWWRRPGTALLIFVEYNKYVAARLTPRWIRVSGFADPRTRIPRMKQPARAAGLPIDRAGGQASRPIAEQTR